MSFTEEELHIFGENIKSIRQANGLNRDDFSQILYISYGQLESIELGRYQVISDDTLDRICKITNLSVDVLKTENISSYLYKKKLSFEKKISLLDFFLSRSDGSSSNDSTGFYEKVFPFIISDSICSESDDFKNGVNIVENKIKKFMFVRQDALDAIRYFFQAYKKNYYLEGLQNCVSCIGYIYIQHLLLLCLNEIIDIEGENFASMMNQFHARLNSNTLKKTKSEFLLIFKESLNLFLSALNEDYKFKDFVLFFNAVRYLLKMYINEDVNLTDEEMEKRGETLVGFLAKTENPYAVDFENYVNKNLK